MACASSVTCGVKSACPGAPPRPTRVRVRTPPDVPGRRPAGASAPRSGRSTILMRRGDPEPLGTRASSCAAAAARDPVSADLVKPSTARAMLRGGPSRRQCVRPNRAHGRRGAPPRCSRPGCALLMHMSGSSGKDAGTCARRQHHATHGRRHPEVSSSSIRVRVHEEFGIS